MQVIEFVVQGVRRLQESFKIQAKPGLVMLVGGNEAGKTTLVDALEATLFPHSSELPPELLPWDAPDVSRAALVFRGGAEQATWRVVRDFAKGASSLSRLDPETKKFSPVTNDPAQIETELLNAGIPPLDLYQVLCVCRRLDTESAAPKSSFGAASDETALLSPEEREAKIKQLEEALEGAGHIEKLQFELDGIEGQKFDWQNKVKRVDELDSNAKKALAALDKPEYEPLASVTKEQEERIRNHEDKSGDRKRELDQLEKQVLALHEEATAASRKKVPFFKNVIFMAGAGVILLSVIFMIVLLAGDNPHATKMILLIMLGGGVAAFGYLNWMKQMAELDAVIAKPEKTEQLRAQTTRKYELEAADVISLLRRLDVDRAGEFLERLAVYRKQKAQADKLRKEADEAKQDPEYMSAAAELKALTERAKALQQEIKKLGAAAAIDPGELRRQLEKLKAVTGKGAGLAGVGAGRLISAAANYLDEGGAILAANILPRVSAMMQTITENRYSVVSLSEDGSATVMHVPSSRERSLSEIGPSVLNAFQFALQGTLIEYVSGKREKLPLIIDSGTGALDDKWLAGLLRALKGVGTKSQVILTTSRSQIATAADLAIKLPG